MLTLQFRCEFLFPFFGIFSMSKLITAYSRSLADWFAAESAEFELLRRVVLFEAKVCRLFGVMMFTDCRSKGSNWWHCAEHCVLSHCLSCSNLKITACTDPIQQKCCKSSASTF